MAAPDRSQRPSDFLTVFRASSLNLSRSSLQILAASTFAALSSFGSAEKIRSAICKKKIGRDVINEIHALLLN